MSRCTDALLWASLAISLCALPSTAMAIYCPNGPYKFVMEAPSFTFDPTVPDNTTLWSGSIRVVGGEGAKCVDGYSYIHQEGTVPLESYQRYASGIPGISFRIKSIGTCYTGYWPGECGFKDWGGHINGHSLALELVKTGPITAGGKLSGQFGRWRTRNMEDILHYSWSSAGGEIKPQTPTCNATQKTLNVSLGKINASVFSGVNSTSPEKSFAITLECSGGVVGATTSLYMTMTDQTTPANRTDQLSLAPSSSASGVAIQVLNGSNLIKYGPDSSEFGNENQWPVPNGQGIGNQTLTIPLTARFIQTQPTIVPGLAKGHATFTLSYK
ncbi:fimbrial protein [Pseudomonas sp. TCU-HL1]|uniref:fimbrial protein n=1 Tax=Pseudomonas sp. TCU-HL1 TaxID=1856685 RepID=UPI000857A635|nr:fimbrial protein [Pseudomonas sp. TCU-HL1]AOE88138.1 hypothetical protein THL1_5591 [Pseudomonas sp. TCU-HL1]